MYFTTKTPTGLVKGANTQQRSCPHCGNQVQAQLGWAMMGPWMGFAGKPLFGKKTYYFQCPVCSEAIEEVTKAQADALGAA